MLTMNRVAGCRPGRHRALARACCGLAVALLAEGAAQGQSVPASPPAADIRAYFTAIRQAAVAADPKLSRPAQIDPSAGVIPLTDCPIAGLQLGIEDSDLDGPAVQLAMEIEQAQRSLQALGVPQPVWRPGLSQLEQVALNYLGAVQAAPQRREAAGARATAQAEQATARLMQQVNQHRRQRQPSAPEVVMAEGCGAGETPVEILTRPAGGRVSLISLFRHRLCEARRLPPDDPRQCRGWIDVVKKTEFLSGQYVYRVRWPDGQTRSGVFDTYRAPVRTVGDEDVARVVLSR